MWKLRSELEKLAEADYKEFNDKLIPGVKNTLGVRLPKMRELAKAAAKEDVQAYLDEIDGMLQRQPQDVSYEEIMIYGLLIGYAKLSDEQRKFWLERFLPYIDNWAVCDCCCTTYKWMRKNTEFWWEYLESCIAKDTEYAVRFAVVCMLDHFVDEEHIDRILEWCGALCADGERNIADEKSCEKPADGDVKNLVKMPAGAASDVVSVNPSKKYYIQMAVAWAVSVCFVKFPEKTFAFLGKSGMDVFTHNKSIQKICESFRVTKEQKDAVRKLRRSNKESEFGKEAAK